MKFTVPLDASGFGTLSLVGGKGHNLINLVQGGFPVPPGFVDLRAAFSAAGFRLVSAGLVETFMEAGAMVESACCGPCMGGSFGLLGPGERCLSTSNRNFVGRQGSPKAFVYLCSPAVAGASAITGYITDPREV